MRALFVILLTAAALVGITSSSTMDSAASASAVGGHHQDGSAKERSLKPGTTDEDRMLNLPFIVDLLKSKAYNLIDMLKSKAKKKDLIDTLTRWFWPQKWNEYSVNSVDDSLRQIGVDLASTNPILTPNFKQWFDHEGAKYTDRMKVVALLEHFDDVQLARMLEAARENEEYEVMAKNLQETLVAMWVDDESLHIEDVLVKFKLDTGLEKALVSPDLFLFNRYINIRNRFCTDEKDRITLLQYLMQVYTEENVVRQIEKLKGVNPRVQELRNRLFEEWLMAQTNPSQVWQKLNLQKPNWKKDNVAAIYLDYCIYFHGPKLTQFVEFNPKVLAI